ncbi:hypothetical protein [Brevibacillus reuszeri]
MVDCNPPHSTPNVIKAFKDVSARMLCKEFLRLKKLGAGNLCNPSYF